MTAFEHARIRLRPLVDRALSLTDRQKVRARSSRPDVSAPFTITLVCAFASGILLAGDLIRMHAPVRHCLAAAAAHPMSYIFGCSVLLLAGLLTAGDV